MAIKGTGAVEREQSILMIQLNGIWYPIGEDNGAYAVAVLRADVIQIKGQLSVDVRTARNKLANAVHYGISHGISLLA